VDGREEDVFFRFSAGGGGFEATLAWGAAASLLEGGSDD